MTAMAMSRMAAVATVTESFVDLQRTVRRSKARLLAAAGDDVESAAHSLLHAVQSEGPMRASALAASVQSDLSTVSRQVAALVGRGLLERRADHLRRGAHRVERRGTAPVRTAAGTLHRGLRPRPRRPGGHTDSERQ
jgi:MarR family protein